jgi:predicted nucleic acid-binding protein
LTLVDTSAWVEFFRGRAPFADAVDDLLATNDVVLCGPVVTELRRGLLPAERRRVLPLLAACRDLPQPEQLWEEAGDLGFWLARRGVSVKSMDLLIAAWALAHSASLLTRDRDFAAMQRAGLPLSLVAP